MRALDATLRLRGVGAQDVDVELRHRARELRGHWAFEACAAEPYGFPGGPKSGVNATSSSRERTDSLRNKLAI